MAYRVKLDKLCDALAEFTNAAKPHLFPPPKTWCEAIRAFLTKPEVVGAAIKGLAVVVAAICGMTAYQQAQIKNKKVEILKTFLPDISQDVATTTGEGNGGDGLDDHFRLQNYRRYIQGSERRYAALVALSQFDDRDLLYQLAIQHPKEGLSVVGNMADGGTGKLHVNEVIKQIINEQETAMNVLASQVNNLEELLDRGQKEEALLTQFAKGRASPELGIIATEERYKRIRTPLLQLTEALVIDGLLELVSAEKKNSVSDLSKSRLTAFLTVAPFIVAAVAEPESHGRLLGSSVNFVANYSLV